MADLKPTVILIRHGDTDLNSGHAGSPERIRGWLDIPLNTAGRKEALRVSKLVCRWPIKRIASSDLSRAVDTARMIRQAIYTEQHRRVPLEITTALRPWNLGDLQGKELDEIMEMMLDLQQNHPTQKAPGGGEAFNTFIKRFISYFSRTLKEAQANPEAGYILLLGHTRDLRAADAWMRAGARGYAIDKSVMGAKEHLGTGEGLMYTDDPKHGWIRRVVLRQSS